MPSNVNLSLSKYLRKESAFPNRLAIDEAKLSNAIKELPSTWIDDFAGFIFENIKSLHLYETKADVLKDLNKHFIVNRSSSAEEIEILFKQIWCVIKKTAEGTIPEGFNYSSEQAVAYAIKLGDGIKNCSNGIHERCVNIWLQMTSPINLANILYSYRTELITNVAHRYLEIDDVPESMEVHELDAYCIIAQDLGLNIHATKAHYKSSEQIARAESYKRRIIQKMKDHYTPLQLLQHIENFLKESLREIGYVGCKKDPESYEDNYMHAEWRQCINKLLGVEVGESELWVTDDYITKVYDLNWSYLKRKIMEKLKDEKIYEDAFPIDNVETVIASEYDYPYYIEFINSLKEFVSLFEKIKVSNDKLYVLVSEIRMKMLSKTSNDAEKAAIHNYFDSNIINLIKDLPLIDTSVAVCFLSHSYFLDTYRSSEASDIQELLTKEKLQQLFSHKEVYKTHVINILIERIKRLNCPDVLLFHPERGDNAFMNSYLHDRNFSTMSQLLDYANDSPLEFRLRLLKYKSATSYSNFTLLMPEFPLNEFKKAIAIINDVDHEVLLSLFLEFNKKNTTAVGSIVNVVNAEKMEILLNLVRGFNRDLKIKFLTSAVEDDKTILRLALLHKNNVTSLEKIINFIDEVNLSKEELKHILPTNDNEQLIPILFHAAKHNPKLFDKLLILISKVDDAIPNKILTAQDEYGQNLLIIASRSKDDMLLSSICTSLTTSNIGPEKIYQILTSQHEGQTALMYAVTNSAGSTREILSLIEKLDIKKQETIFQIKHNTYTALDNAAVESPAILPKLIIMTREFSHEVRKKLLYNYFINEMQACISSIGEADIDAVNDIYKQHSTMLRLESFLADLSTPSAVTRIMGFLFNNTQPYNRLREQSTRLSKSKLLNHDEIAEILTAAIRNCLSTGNPNKTTTLLNNCANLLNQEENFKLREILLPSWSGTELLQPEHLIVRAKLPAVLNAAIPKSTTAIKPK